MIATQQLMWVLPDSSNPQYCTLMSINSDPSQRSKENVVDRLSCHASVRGSNTALVCLDNDNIVEAHYSYRELDDRVRRIAGWLQQQKLIGERILIATSDIPSYVCGLLG